MSKFILRQLRPVSGLDFWLETAIDDLIAFSGETRVAPISSSSARSPSRINLGRRGEEAAYRIVQESA